MSGLRHRRAAAAVILAGLGALLAGCLIAPGKFESNLDIRRDGHFAFHYTGEIRMLALSQFAHDAATPAKFTPECFDIPPNQPATGQPTAAELAPVSRLCTPAEIAEQRHNWDAAQAEQAATKQQQAAQMKAMFGGIDPTSPQAAAEFVARLQHQAGWRRVVDKGNGVFDVDFAAAGDLSHDFAFPTIEKQPYVTPFLTVYRHADGMVRIEAPAFVGTASNGMSLLLASQHAQASDSGVPASAIDGHFTLTSDAPILANNTEEGPQGDPAGQRLAWRVTPSTTTAPTALLRLTPPAPAR